MLYLYDGGVSCLCFPVVLQLRVLAAGAGTYRQTQLGLAGKQSTSYPEIIQGRLSGSLYRRSLLSRRSSCFCICSPLPSLLALSLGLTASTTTCFGCTTPKGRGSFAFTTAAAAARSRQQQAGNLTLLTSQAVLGPWRPTAS